MNLDHEIETRAALFDASEQAYQSLVEQGYPEEDVHRISVCYDAAALMAQQMTEIGYVAEHELRVSSELGEHSFVRVGVPGSGKEVIADPTWMQFLRSNSGHHAPRSLIGTRGEVAHLAQTAGVNPAAVDYWTGDLPKGDPELIRQGNVQAEANADSIDDLWDKFMQAV